MRVPERVAPLSAQDRWPLLGRTSWAIWLYEATMGTMALAVLWTLALPDRGWVRALNLAVWGLFVLDYVVRLALTRDRMVFVHARWVEAVAILPLDLLGMARLTRAVRLLRGLRAGAVAWRTSRGLRGVLATNRLAYVLGLAAALILGGAVAIAVVEPQIGGFGDALWWSVVTTTTVGYGDVAPATVAGRIVAVTLMLIGIGTMGMIAGTVATYFLRSTAELEDDDLSFVADQLQRWDELSPAQRRAAAALLREVADR